MTQPVLMPNALHFSALPPLALYIHMPWCVRKCPYCDFNSHALRDGVPEQEYVAALISDLELALPQIWGRPIHTIFMGGGTPSLFSPEAIDSLLTAIRARVRLLPDAEITLEANPGTVEIERLRGFRAAGINRVSLGIQSFNSEHLEALGRIHSSREARHAIEAAAELFPTFNIDLMYALPRQTLEQMQADIDTALSYAPPHLSCYHLTLEPNTLFHRYPPPLPDDDQAADMQEWLEQRLERAGYEHYETSAFARPDQRCRHNINYWTFGDYLGIGAGAHSKLSFPHEIVREMRYKQPGEYLQQIKAGVPVQQRHTVPVRELPFEFMMNALRLSEGFSPALYAERSGRPWLTVERELRRAEAEGLLTLSAEQVQPTLHGRRFLNDLLQRFLPD